MLPPTQLNNGVGTNDDQKRLHKYLSCPIRFQRIKSTTCDPSPVGHQNSQVNDIGNDSNKDYDDIDNQCDDDADDQGDCYNDGNVIDDEDSPFPGRVSWCQKRAQGWGQADLSVVQMSSSHICTYTQKKKTTCTIVTKCATSKIYTDIQQTESTNAEMPTFQDNLTRSSLKLFLSSQYCETC